MQDIYKKIEKRIVDLKKKEEVWKGRYREIARQMKELVDSTSVQMKQMETAIRGLEEKTEAAELKVKKTTERSEELLKLMDKRMVEISEVAKSASERAEGSERQVKKLKSDAASQVNEMIAKQEKTFAGVLEKIKLATKSIEGEFKKEESLYDRMEGTRKFLESYTPPEPAIIHAYPRREEIEERRRQEPPSGRQSEPASSNFRPPVQSIPSIPSAPAPERGSSFVYAAPMTLPPNSMRQPPRMLSRMHDDIDDLDDDLEMDDMVSENMKGFRSSVDSMDSSIAGIAQKLATIEEKFAKMQQSAGPADVERLDDKIRMYTQSVEGIHSRMGTVEKALKDGMTPMMETMKMLTETVKSMKDEATPSVRKPAPPTQTNIQAKGVIIPTPSNRVPQSFQAIHAKRPAKPHPGLGVGYG